MITLSFVNYWRKTDDYFLNFIETNIGKIKLVNYNDNPDILFASCMGNINTIHNIKAKCKIFYYGENLNRYPPYNNDKLLYDTFDLIVGFKKTDLTKKQIRFPLWLRYYNYYNYDASNNLLTHIQNKYNQNVNDKTLFASIVARHDRGGQRGKIYDELCKYGEIKSPSNYRKNTNSIGTTNTDKINFIAKSIYNICPENSKNEGYFTEKIFQAFEGGTIPLYWGVSLPEPEIINENKYCFCNVENQKDLKNSIRDVCINAQKYKKGNLFKENAPKQLNQFYSELTDNIKKYIK